MFPFMFAFAIVSALDPDWTLIEDPEVTYLMSEGHLMPLRSFPNATNSPVNSPVSYREVEFLQKIFTLTPTEPTTLADPPWTAKFTPLQNSMVAYTFYLPAVEIPAMKCLHWKATYSKEVGSEAWIEYQLSGAAARGRSWEYDWVRVFDFTNVSFDPP